MFLRLTILACLSFFFLAEANDSAAVARIDAYLSQNQSNGFTGSVLIAKGDQILLNKGYGFANRETKAPHTPQTIYTVGSVSKQFTGAAIMKLVDMGKVKVNEPLKTFWPNIPADKANITVHHLLTHSAGFVDYVGNGDFDMMPRETFFNRLFDQPLLHAPGTYTYSNAGYSALARIVEITSGMEYEAFLQEHLFRPLGMKNTGYLLPEWDDSKLSTGYRGGVRPVGPLINRFRENSGVSWGLKGNGGIHSTQEDMLVWINAIRSGKVLSAASTKAMLSPHVPESSRGTSHYGYGWVVRTSKQGKTVYSHNGSNMIWFHHAIWEPESELTILYASNVYSEQTEGIGWRIRKMFLIDDYKPEPIEMNGYQLVQKFISNHNPSEIDKLHAHLKDHYGPEFKDVSLLNRMGYWSLDDPKTIEWGVAMMELNVKLFPNNDNIWDSLGDGYKKQGKREKAIEAYTRAVQLNPVLTASINSLKELGAKVPERKAITIDPVVLKQYAGTYELRKGFLLQVTVEGGTLYCQPGGRDKIAGEALSENAFYLQGPNVRITFNREEGAIKSLTLHDGQEMVAPRI